MNESFVSRTPPAWLPQFRHVVFRDAAASRSRVVDLAPAGRGTVPPERSELSEDEEAFLRWLFREAGLDLRKYRLRTLKRRIPACLRVLQAGNFSEARYVLSRKPALLPVALSTMVIGVTSFFRDAGVFQALQQQVLPELLESRFGLAAWSVGCSDGSELYSLAMALAEMGALSRWHLLGTDCRHDAIRRARAGVYDAGAVKGVPPPLLERYFVRQGGQWAVAPSVAGAATWRVADVLGLHEPGVWDLILCRNMTMYMTPEATAPLWPRLAASLRPGGILVLGKAERPLGASQLTSIGPCIYRKSKA